MDLQGVFVKIGHFIKFKGFLVEFLESRRSWENQKPPRKSPEKWTFLSLAFYNAPSLHTVELIQMTLKMVIGSQWEWRGDCGRQDGNGNGNSSEFQDGNGNGNLGEINSQE